MIPRRVIGSTIGFDLEGPGLKLMPLMEFTCAFALAMALLPGFACAFSADLFAGQMDPFSEEGGSSSNSSMRFQSQTNMTGAQFNLSLGSGYYASHPITYGPAIGSRTQMVNTGSSASMQHAVDSAREIQGTREFMAVESSRRQDGSLPMEGGDFATTQMKIDETVTDGRVHLGAIQGGDAPEQELGGREIDPAITAWKRPSFEVDEEYVGSYHIYKNITINKDYTLKTDTDGWLNCCAGYLDPLPREPAFISFISADNVFSIKKFK